tara:strand:- start:87 stop:1430 length:1344 start_codon:yes stop_codon:yes gene_type:complete
MAQPSGYGGEQEYGDSVQPRDIDTLIPEMDAPAELWLFVEDYRFVTGKMIHLTLQLIWKLGVSIDVEGFNTADLSPFKIEKVTVGERQIFNNDSDFSVVTYILSLPDDAEMGIYTVPAFLISYADEANKKLGQVQTSSMALKKVPILVETGLDRDVIAIGDTLKYTLTIWHEKYVQILEENMKQLNLSPFDLRDFRINKEAEGKLKKTTIEYDLSIYDLPDKSENFEIPSMPVLYCDEREGNVKQGEEGKLPATQKIGTPAIPVMINSLLKRIDVPLEKAKGPLVYSAKDVWLRSHLPAIMGYVIIIALGFNEIKKIVCRMSAIVRERMAMSPLAHAQTLEKMVAGFDSDAEEDKLRQSIVNIDCTLRGFLGALKEMRRDVVRSITTARLIDTIRDKNMAEEIVGAADNVLKSFDGVIFGDVNRDAIKKAMDGVQEILREAKRRSYF